MNSNIGDMRSLSEMFTKKEAEEQGYTQIFKEGQLLHINDCFFVVNNFVEDKNFMNLRLISKREAADKLFKECKKF